MRFDVVSVLPGMFAALTGHGVIGRALGRGIAEVRLWNPRDFTRDVHHSVDDRPYGGGPGMVMKFAPLRLATLAIREEVPTTQVTLLSPQGRRVDQGLIRELAQRPGMVLVCGRYEGIDERWIQSYVDEEVSIGDYVLSGGELAAMVLMDAVIRLLPGTLGDADSAQQDSYMDGLLDHPHYTRPEEVEGRQVPKVLLSGDHEVIRRWRLQQALGRTWMRRPDLLAERRLNPEERRLLDEFIQAQTDA